MSDWKLAGLEYLENHPICELCRERPSCQVHHIFGRIGSLRGNPLNFIALCFDCHYKAEFISVRESAFEIFKVKLRIPHWGIFASDQQNKLYTEFKDIFG